MALCHRQTQIRWFYSKSLSPFMNSVNFFLIPCRTDTCSVCQPSETDYKWFLFSLQRFTSSPRAPVKRFLHITHICNFTVCQSFNCFTLFQTVSGFSISRAVAISVCVQDSASSLKMFTEYFPVMMNTLLKVFIPPHPPPLFYLPHITGWQFFTFHTFHQKHLHLLFSILLLCLTFWFQAPEALALLFMRLSPGYLMLPSFTLSVYFQMFHTWSKM